MNSGSFQNQLSDYWLPLGVFLIGAGFSLYVLLFSGSLSEFFHGIISNDLIFIGYYLWLKALVMDINRIKNKERLQMPLYIYWIYGLQGVIFWMINDIAFGTSQLSGLVSVTRLPRIIELYFTNRQLFWLIMEVFSSVILFPISKLLRPSRKSIEVFITYDFFRYILILLVFEFLGSNY